MMSIYDKIISSSKKDFLFRSLANLNYSNIINDFVYVQCVTSNIIHAQNNKHVRVKLFMTQKEYEFCK